VDVDVTSTDEPVPETADRHAATVATTCPSCGAEVGPAELFCEACGATLTPVAAATSVPDSELESPITLSRSVRAPAVADAAAAVVAAARPCASCGGVVGADGYCEICGTKATSERDHYVEEPSSWVGACCDRGVRHYRNEDATATASDPEPGSRAVLVVCDGVSNSRDSDVASLAAARSARDLLAASRPTGMGTPTSRAAAIASSLEAAALGANRAVGESTVAGGPDSPSCTFAAAVVDAGLAAWGTVGDSRVYWIPDEGAPRQLSVDDSVAEEQIAAGTARRLAENGPQGHAITRWLGADSPDASARTGSTTLEEAGWLLVCSDGLWNYASEATELAALVARLAESAPDPRPLAEALVTWACEQGGRDNISVALARQAAS
jgi:serine/threonine protein phosphatase PrpC